MKHKFYGAGPLCGVEWSYKDVCVMDWEETDCLRCRDRAAPPFPRVGGHPAGTPAPLGRREAREGSDPEIA